MVARAVGYNSVSSIALTFLILFHCFSIIRIWDDFDNYAYPFTEIGWDYGVAINPLLYTQEEWNRGKIFPFHKNVESDGIEIK